MQFTDPTFLSLCLSAAAYLIMLVVVLRRGSLRATTSWMLLGCIVFSLGWTVFHGLLRLQTLGLIAGFDPAALERISRYLLLALAVIFLQLTRLFLRRQPAIWQARSELPWWAGGALLTAAIVAFSENWLRLPDPLFQINNLLYYHEPQARLAVWIGWAAALAGSFLLIAVDFRRKLSPLHRNRNNYWALALALTAAGGGLTLTGRVTAGSLLHLAGLAAAMYALLTFQLPDLRLAVRDSASYIITTALTILLYTGGFLAAQSLLRGLRPEYTLLVGLGLAAALAMLFNPLLQLAGRFVRQLISGARYDSRQVISEYSMRISNILDLERLATMAIGIISETMEITHGALVTVTAEEGSGSPGDGPPVSGAENGGVYVLRSISGLGEALPEGRISAANPAAYYLRREHHPLTQYDIDLLPRFQEMDPEERAWFSGLNMDIFVPIYAQDAWIGLLALGQKASGDRYFPEDLSFLQTLADQTAVALENARLYENLKQRNAENERLNAELTAANAELARLDKAKSDFINIASHELRTPLTQIMGFNDILHEMISSGDVEKGVALQMTGSVRKSARRLEEIVETMFDVSKLDTRTLDLACGPVSLMTVLAAALDNWQAGMEQRNITLVMRGINNLPEIYADGQRLTQVFSNLVQNAIKSTPDGGQIAISGRITGVETLPPSVACRAAGGENGRNRRFAEIIIADNGIGIAPEDLERIFEKFYRVGNVLLHSTGDTKFKGAGPGLGLTIARGIVEAHGGCIWAESPGYDEVTCPGSKFHVLLPIENHNLEENA